MPRYKQIPEISLDDQVRFYLTACDIRGGGKEYCWIWEGQYNAQGEPIFDIGESKPDIYLARRVSYFIFRGEQPGNKLVSLNCPKGIDLECVNPDHLWLATAREEKEYYSTREIKIIPARVPPAPRYIDTGDEIIWIETPLSQLPKQYKRR